MKCNPWVGGSIGRRGFPMLGNGSRGFSTHVKGLFKNGEQGFFYDPNDLSTMFQDAAGTVPVTAVGQPVGLVLDKSKGLQLGDEKVTNGSFDSDTVWIKAATVTVSGGSAILNNASGNPALSQNVGIIPNAWYDVTIVISELSAGGLVFRCYGTGGNDGVLGIPTAGTYKFKMKARSDATGLIGFSASSTSAKIDSVSVREVLGNHAYQTTSASRPILRQNAVTGANYLEFDGSDDFLQTGGIDFTATDKVSLFTGVRKLSDLTAGVIFEHGNAASNSKAFTLDAPPAAGVPRYGLNLRNTTRASIFADLRPAPRSSVISGILNYSGTTISTQVMVRENSSNLNMVESGVVVASTTFGNYPLYIGRRGGASLPFGGHVYSLIGVGKLVSDIETIAIEKELAKRVGVTLNV